MKKIALSLVFTTLTILLFSGCEKDDICVDAVTPQLIIRFYDNENFLNTKDVVNLKVIGEDMEEPIINRVTTDSIAIPLRTLEDTTTFVFLTNSGDDDEGNEVGIPDTITFTYLRNEIYVSRACGYKTNYEQLSYTTPIEDFDWITNLIIVNNDVTDETAAHINIYH